MYLLDFSTVVLTLSSILSADASSVQHSSVIAQRQNSTSTACNTAVCLPSFVLRLSPAQNSNILQCLQLASAFPSNVHLPGNGNFTVWDAKQQDVVSACRVLPSTNDEVLQIMSVLLDNWCSFAVKGGGHARNPDDSVSVGGITVDMANFKSIDIAPNRTLVKLGSGHTLYTLYTGLEQYNLTTVAGRSGGVGLGGYALGGGFSNLSPQYGLAIDNIFEYDLVLPNATLITVNQHNHPDLYFALRGGMSNFGIVTHYTMSAIPQGKIFGGDLAFTADKLDAVATATYELTTNTTDTLFSYSYGYGYNQDSDSFSISLNEAYMQPITDPPVFRALNSIKYESSTLRIDWMSNFSVETANATPNGGRNLFATISYYPSASLDQQVMQIMAEEIQPIKNVSGFFPNVISQAYTAEAISAGTKRGGNAYGIDVDGPLTVILLTSVWDNAEDDEALYAFAGRWIERAKTAAVNAGKYYRWMYINYAYTTQEPFSGYSATNQARLKAIQKDVDPEGVFASHGLCRGYFKLN